MAYSESDNARPGESTRHQTPTFLLGCEPDDRVDRPNTWKAPTRSMPMRPAVILTIDGHRHFYIDPVSDDLFDGGELPGRRHEAEHVRENILSSMEQRFGLDREIVEKAVNDVLRLV